MIEPLAPKHLDAVARLHQGSLTGLLSALGFRAIRAFYEGSIQSEWNVGFVDSEDGRVGGFVLGSARPAQLRRDVRESNRLRTWHGVGIGLVRRPSLIAWLWRSLRQPGGGGYDTEAPELIYVAVDERNRGAGSGKRLVEAFGQALHDRGVDAFELSVDAENRTAIEFYDRLGFRPVGEYREFGVLHKRLRRDLGSPSAPHSINTC